MNNELKSLVGKQVSSVNLHYYFLKPDFESLDWITFCIENQYISFTTGKHAEDIVTLFDYSKSEIVKEFEGYDLETMPEIVTKEFDISTIANTPISKITLLERNNMGYANTAMIYFGNDKLLCLYGGADCINIELYTILSEA